MRIKFSYILLLLICLGLTATAQRRSSKKTKKQKAKITREQKRPATKDTALQGTTIEILQNYTPEVKKTPKPEFSPTLPPVDNKLPVFSYDVPKQNLNYTYSSMPIRALALGKNITGDPFANYVKFGAGSLSTLYLDAGIGSLKGDNYETAIHLKHLSQKGEFDDQKTSLTGLDAEGTLHTYNHALHADLGVSQNSFHYYGYNHDVYNYGIDSLKQAFTNIRLGIDVKNETEHFKNISYHPSIKFSSYSDRFDASEMNLNIDAPLSYKINEEMEFRIGLHAAITQLNVKTSSIDNNIIKLTPSLHYRKDNFAAHAGIYPTIGKNKNYILPDLEAAYSINNQFTINAGLQSLLIQNTYEQLSSLNPFMYNTYLVQQTRSRELFAGIKGSVGQHISFTGRVSGWQYADMPLFINDTSTVDKKQFIVVYDKVSALSLQLAARYQVANTFSVGLSMGMNSYTSDVYRHAWHQPGFNLKGDLLIKPIEKLTVTAYVSVLDGMYAVDKGNTSVKLKPAMDIGGGAEYNFLPRLSGFLQVNNLLNNKYQRWYGYNSYGLNIYGGLRLKF